MTVQLQLQFRFEPLRELRPFRNLTEETLHNTMSDIRPPDGEEIGSRLLRSKRCSSSTANATKCFMLWQLMHSTIPE